MHCVRVRGELGAILLILFILNYFHQTPNSNFSKPASRWLVRDAEYLNTYKFMVYTCLQLMHPR